MTITERLSQRSLALLVISVLLMLIGGANAQEVYKVVNEDGSVTYTDDPGDKPAEKVELREPTVVPAVTPRPPLQSNRDNNDNVPKSYEVLITSPEPETHLNPGDWDLAVVVATDPGVHASHRVQILDNGEVKSDEGSTLVIKAISRGTHTLTAQVVNERGRVISTSAPVTVYVHRPTVNSPARK
jgi:hypothetical protein